MHKIKHFDRIVKIFFVELLSGGEAIEPERSAFHAWKMACKSAVSRAESSICARLFDKGIFRLNP